MLNNTTKISPWPGAASRLYCGVWAIAILMIAASCVKRPRAASGGGGDEPETCANGQTLVDGVCQTTEQPGTVIEEADKNPTNNDTFQAVPDTATDGNAPAAESTADTTTTDQTTEPTAGADAYKTKGGDSAKPACTAAQTEAYEKCLLSNADAATCKQQANCSMSPAESP